MPERSGRKRGRGPQHLANLLNVVDLLLDLADTSSLGGWMAIQATSPEHLYNDLKSALVVRWDKSRLLVSSSRKDPDQEDCELKATRHSKTGSLEAIRKCLKATESKVMTRRLYLESRGANTSEEVFARDRIRNALNDLGDLRLREDTERRKPGAGRANSANWSFWIVFPANLNKRKQDCLTFIEKRWNEEFHHPEGEAVQQQSSLVKSQELAETKKRLDNLDRWIQNNLNGWRQRFEARDEVRERCIHVPLATAIRLSNADAHAAGRTSVIRELRPEDIQSVVAENGSQMLMIWEEGGAGKTSLAFEIARWGLDGKLADHVLLPILLDLSPEKGNLVERVQEQLSHVDRSIQVDHVRDLLSHRRLLVIVDHFSECTMAQRQWFVEHCRPQDIDLVLLTSRQQEGSHFGGWLISTIQPQRLQDEALFCFFESYLNERSKRTANVTSVSPLLSPEDQVRTRDLLERMVGNKPITVLLAWMVIDKAIEHIHNGSVDLLPSSVPELMLNYVERCSIALQAESQCLEAEPKTAVDCALIEAILKKLALAAHEQNHAYKPQNFGLKLARGVLASICSNIPDLQAGNQPLHLLQYLDKKLSLLQEKGRDSAGPIYRISLDPLADYLAALALIENLTTPPSSRKQLRALQGWLGQLSGQLELENPDRRSLMRGFLSACRDVSKDWLMRLPDGLDANLREQWNQIPHRFAQLAGIDPLEERQLEARHLIRRHAGDLAWANPELRPKALAELSAYAREFAGCNQLGELEEAVDPVKNVFQKTSLPARDRAAAAEALGLIGGQKAADALERMIDNEHEPSVAVRRAAAEALGLIAAVGSNLQRHWDLLETTLMANSLQDERDPERISTVLPLLQGASLGLQRIASRHLPQLGLAKGMMVPMLSLTSTNGAITTRVLEVPVWMVELPDGLSLELVEVQSCSFQIGSPEEEDGREAYARHREVRDAKDVEALRPVTVEQFFLARYPVTQAQWRSLANYKYRANSDLSIEPAYNKGDDLPVECVSWYAANEWCQRLEKHLRQGPAGISVHVSLPSEAQWEIACRAGSSSPFHFGDCIDSTWANYDGNYKYSAGRKGEFLGRTSAVGDYGLVNSYGLADLHGNVWEWCKDAWAPSVISRMQDEKEKLDQVVPRIVRGGSFSDGPIHCRSAFRGRHVPEDDFTSVGFRPAFLSPASSASLGSPM